VRDGTLWLVGMMGAGKSSVGAALASLLALEFIDLDRAIEAAAGRSIAELFAAEGEAAFRKREREAIEGVAGRRAVVALGGGAMAQPGVASLLLASGTAIYLRARAETLAARVGEDEARPLLAGLGAEQRLARLASLLAEREGAYLRAPLVIDTEGLDAAGVAAEIAARLGGSR
jgi:shikimate kinase